MDRSGLIKLLNKLQKVRVLLPLAIYVASIIFLFAHSHIELNFHTYISENALSPGVVDNEFYEESDLNSYYETLKSKHKASEPLQVQDYLLKEMESIGLDVGIHNYSLSYPELFNVESLMGANVYGILRAPRAERTEALVMSCWIGEGSGGRDEHLGNHAGMALMLTMAKSFRRRLYWAKDIVFLFTDMHFIGLQAWLLSHHGMPSPRLYSQPLPVRTGLIQAAINFELPKSRFRYVNVKLEGVNGIMPNLDLVNTVSVLAQKYELPLRLHDVRTHPDPRSTQGLHSALRTLARMMMAQASGSPNGQHGLFLPYQIPALSLSAPLSTGYPSDRLSHLARVVEGVMRSLNNLQERFHQSFFFYLLPRLDRYVSIGVYMVPFAGVVIPGILQALLLWLEVSDEYKMLPGAFWWQLLPCLLPCLMFGLAAFAGSSYFLTSAKMFGVSPPNGLMGGLLALSVSALFYPWLLKRRTQKKLLADWRFYKAAILIAQSLMIGCLGVLNISMATFVSLLMVPTSLIVRPVERSWLRAIVMLIQLLAHPICILTLGIVVHSQLRDQTLSLPVLSNAFRQAVLQGLVEQEFLASWTVRIATMAVFPIWLSFWGLVLS